MIKMAYNQMFSLRIQSITKSYVFSSNLWEVKSASSEDVIHPMFMKSPLEKILMYN